MLETLDMSQHDFYQQHNGDCHMVLTCVFTVLSEQPQALLLIMLSIQFEINYFILIRKEALRGN